MLVVLCGPPATGKTTLARGLRERLAARGVSVRVLHSDDFARETYERMYERVAGAEADDHWILDGTFYDREWQERFRALGARIVWVRADRETALERNRRREDPIPEKGVHVMYATFDRPRADLVIDTDECTVAEALDRLEAAVLAWLDED